MIYNVRGRLTVTEIDYVVVECNGVGFKCFTSLNTSKTLGKTGDEVNVYTYLSVREDAMDLFGFSSLSELDAFKLLITVSGVGPKAAISILSELTPDMLAICIASGDAKSITNAKGIGKKTAERVVLELKDKMGSITSGNTNNMVNDILTVSNSSNAGEAVEALMSLGYSQSDASVVVSSLDKSLSVDEMIRHALKQLAKNL